MFMFDVMFVSFDVIIAKRRARCDILDVIFGRIVIIITISG